MTGNLGRTRPRLGGALIASIVTACLGACGARTSLDLTVGEATGPAIDAGFDAVGADVEDGSDADSSDDVSVVDAIAPFDAFVPPDSSLACPDGGTPTAYLFDGEGSLWTFLPATLEAHFLGTPDCGSQAQMNGPWTLSVSHEGVAYLVYEDWNIYAVDLGTLACTRTPFQSGQLGLSQDFAIAVSRATVPEQLFVYGQPTAAPGPILARANLSSFVLTEVAPALPVPLSEPNGYDMQADLLGHLFVYSVDGVLTEIAAATGEVTGSSQTGFPPSSMSSWAVMTYDADVYLFGDNQVARYDFTTGKAVVLGGMVNGPADVVGASAVPCAGPP